MSTAAGKRLRQLTGLGDGALLDLDPDAATAWQSFLHSDTENSEKLALLNHPKLIEFATATPAPQATKEPVELPL